MSEGVFSFTFAFERDETSAGIEALCAMVFDDCGHERVALDLGPSPLEVLLQGQTYEARCLECGYLLVATVTATGKGTHQIKRGDSTIGVKK